MTQSRSPRSKGGVGLWGAVAIGIGGMVGGGIFAVLGVVAEQAGGAAPLAFLLAGGVALVTASSYAALCVRYPSRGGSVVFVDRVFGVRLATGALNNLLWFGYLVTLALYAVAFANYAATFFVGDGDVAWWLHHLLITVAIVVPTGLNLLSAAVVAEAETTIVGLKLAMLALVGAFGVTTVQSDRLAVGSWPTLPVVAAAGMLVFVAYEGFELIANAGEDVANPRRNLPRALYISVGAVIVIYVLVAAVTVGSLSSDQIVSSADFALAEAARPSLGNVGFIVVAASAVLATLSAINATVYGAARLSYSIAMEGELPPAFERKVWSEPVGLLVTAVMSLIIANGLDVTEISSLASAVFLIVFAVVNAAAFWAQRANLVRAGAAAVGVLGCLIALVLLAVHSAGNQPVALIVLIAMVVLSSLGEGAWLHRRRRIALNGSAKG